MRNSHLGGISLILWVFWLVLTAQMRQPGDPIALIYPASWPKPLYDFSKNPLTRQGIELGRRLFYDPILSRDSTISCASCHLSFTAFAHVDHTLSHGIENRIGTRNALVLSNLAWSTYFMWDGAVQHLDFQALAPIAHPLEMDFSIEQVVQRLNETKRYPARFFEAFGDSTATGATVLKALAQFELTLVSANAKYDRVKAGLASFTDQEQNGYRLFQQNCASCHAEPLFTHGSFEKNGLPLDTALNDFGRMRISQNPADGLKFKVPTLRNIEFSYPYMHDGRFRKLRDVINYYAETTALQQKIELTPNEKIDLLAFLFTLTDRDFLFNPMFGFPMD
jgi:cytochrome c peroxidase